MCGIIGTAGWAPTQDTLGDSLERLRHRGPDGSGSRHFDGRNGCSGAPLWLGHTRLAILDLSPSGRQPMVSRDTRWSVTYNGEIYNHLELRRELPGPFGGHSDTETLVEALAQWGLEETLKRLNGMFAFAAVDRESERLYLVRDPFGVKPLYYVEPRPSHLAFCSELRPLLAIAPQEVDRQSLETFLSLRYIPSPHTLFENIKRLPPGHFLAWDVDGREPSLVRYIEPCVERYTGSLEDATRDYHDLLRDAVRRQMISDVPVGILLSGGIDSALVAQFASQHATEPLDCFTVGFGDGHPECEIEAAKETASVLGLAHHRVTVEPDELWQCFENVVRSVEEPLGTPSILPMAYLVKKAREHVTVVLTGQGSDEPWGGYRRYQGEVLRGLLPKLLLVRSLLSALARIPKLPEFAERALRSLPEAETLARFEASYCLFTAARIERLLGEAPARSRSLDAIAYWLDWLDRLPLRDVERMMRIDSRLNLSDDLLLYGDKISMSVSLEARVPMLDLELVRFVESLPTHFKVHLGRTKVVHKKMAEAYLPKTIVHRRKRGFPMPFRALSRGPWRQSIRSVLLDAGQPHLRYLRRNELEGIVDQHMSGRRDWSRQLFSLLALATWFRVFKEPGGENGNGAS